MHEIMSVFAKKAAPYGIPAGCASYGLSDVIKLRMLLNMVAWRDIVVQKGDVYVTARGKRDKGLRLVVVSKTRNEEE